MLLVAELLRVRPIFAGQGRGRSGGKDDHGIIYRIVGTFSKDVFISSRGDLISNHSSLR